MAEWQTRWSQKPVFNRVEVQVLFGAFMANTRWIENGNVAHGLKQAMEQADAGPMILVNGDKKYVVCSAEKFADMGNDQLLDLRDGLAHDLKNKLLACSGSSIG